jgi:hypothetical protein
MKELGHFDWEVLACAARRAPTNEIRAPLGLAARVLALAQAQREEEVLCFLWGWRAAFTAVALALTMNFVWMPAKRVASTEPLINAQIQQLIFSP